MYHRLTRNILLIVFIIAAIAFLSMRHEDLFFCNDSYFPGSSNSFHNVRHPHYLRMHTNISKESDENFFTDDLCNSEKYRRGFYHRKISKTHERYEMRRHWDRLNTHQEWIRR